MSPRIKKLRKVISPPPIKGFKPYGPDVSGLLGEPIMLHFEEYEALKLCDYDMLNHHQASVAMGVSRPTFTRIYSSVRKKIAQAFAEGRQITIAGGKVYFDSDWYSCDSCRCFFNNPFKDIEILECPLCSSNKVKGCSIESECINSEQARCNDLCICIGCGHEMPHEYGQPCNHELCPKCGKRMMRKHK